MKNVEMFERALEAHAFYKRTGDRSWIAEARRRVALAAYRRRFHSETMGLD